MYCDIHRKQFNTELVDPLATILLNTNACINQGLLVASCVYMKPVVNPVYDRGDKDAK